MFRTERREAAIEMKFDFAEGFLTSASGNEVTLAEGDVR